MWPLASASASDKEDSISCSFGLFHPSPRLLARTRTFFLGEGSICWRQDRSAPKDFLSTMSFRSSCAGIVVLLLSIFVLHHNDHVPRRDPHFFKNIKGRVFICSNLSAEFEFGHENCLWLILMDPLRHFCSFVTSSLQNER